GRRGRRGDPDRRLAEHRPPRRRGERDHPVARRRLELQPEARPGAVRPRRRPQLDRHLHGRRPLGREEDSPCRPGKGRHGTALDIPPGAPPSHHAGASGRPALPAAPPALPPPADPAPTFAAAVNYTAGAKANAVALGAVNGDGRLDMAVANTNGATVTVRLGTGSGAFGAASTLSVAPRPDAVALADLGGDGKLDLVTANRNGRNISVLRGDGAGGFTAATNFSVANDRPVALVVTDVNGDGKPD